MVFFLIKDVMLKAVLLAGALCAGALAHADYRIETVTGGLAHPWSMAFLPDGRMLVTERTGQLRLIDAQGKLQAKPIRGMPTPFVATQAGLMDVVLDPHFASDPWIYLSYAHGELDANNTRLARARLVDGELRDFQVLFTAQPAKAGASHYGGRIAFLPDDTLVLTLGDGFDWREQAQNLANHLGKTVRLNRDGSIPQDNPLRGQPGAAGEIYSLGHRNVQGIVYDRQRKRLYSHEHGPKGGDELNLLQPGGNYGWPLTSFGVDYTGAMVTPFTELPGYLAPELHWTPSVAPSGLALYTGERFPHWKGDLFVSTLAEKSVRRVRLDKGRLAGEDILFQELEERIRGVYDGPDGALYLLTDSEDGKLLRVVPL